MRVPPFLYEFPDSDPLEILDRILELFPEVHLFSDDGRPCPREEVKTGAVDFKEQSSSLAVILSDSSPLKSGVRLGIGQVGDVTNLTFQPWSTVDFCRWIKKHCPALVQLAREGSLTVVLPMVDDPCRPFVDDQFKGIPGCEIVK
jgi:hypothetical protein